MMAPQTRDTPEDLIKAYKALLGQIIDRRPSGTRQRLADALGKHRSFITQITGAAYPTPLPERHLATIFSVCHFSAEEQRSFMKAYDAAHPERAGRLQEFRRLRHIAIMVPDFGDDVANRRFDEAVAEFSHRMGALMEDGFAKRDGETKAGGK
jgi:hypothetical protein